MPGTHDTDDIFEIMGQRSKSKSRSHKAAMEILLTS